MSGHDEMISLLGAYALKALSPLEERRVRRHLEDCESCAREVKLHNETAAELSELSGSGVGAEQPIDDLVDRIVAAVPLERSRSRWLSAGSAVAAAAVIIAGAFGLLYGRERSAGDRLAAIVASAERVADLSALGRFEGTGTLYLTDGEAALVLDDLPAPGPSRSYQLWAIDADGPRSMAVFTDSGRVVRLFPWEGGGDRFAVTVEPEGGSTAPTTDPLLISA